MPEVLRESAVGTCTVQDPGFGRNANDWSVVLVSALYGASATAYAGKTLLSIRIRNRQDVGKITSARRYFFTLILTLN